MLSEEKMLFAEHLSLMIKGGVPLVEALDILEKGAKSKIFKKALENIKNKVLQGESLSSALESQVKIFDGFYQNIVRVGEESGQLAENLSYLAQKLEKDIETAKKIKSAMIYPVIVASLALIIAFSTVFFILPKFTNLFQLLNIQLPLATRTLVSIAVFLKKYWLLLAIFIAVLFFLLKLLAKINSVSFLLDGAKLNLPILGKITRSRNLAFFSRTLHTLLKSGTPLLNSLNIVSEIIPNKVYGRNLADLKASVEHGEKISDGLKCFPKNFPLVFSEMILVGEKSGSLEQSLLYLAKFHEKEVDQAIKNISAILEPALLIAVGLFVAFITLAVITPIYKFTGQLKFR